MHREGQLSMQDDIKKHFEYLEKLSNLKLNNSLIASLTRRVDSTDLNRREKQLGADLYRKSGQLAQSISIYNDIDPDKNRISHIAEVNGPSGAKMPIVHLKSQDKGNGFSSSPLFMVDDFLQQPLLDELFQYAIDNQPDYFIDQRNRYILKNLGKFTSHFQNYLSDNLDIMSKCLNVEEFSVRHFEIKLTNYLDGVFFKPHHDGRYRLEEDRGTRQITWLYYFHQQPKQFDGGDLYVFDTTTENNSYQSCDFTKVVTQHNRFVAFPSCYFHAVAPIVLPTSSFGSGRMAVSGHIQISETT